MVDLGKVIAEQWLLTHTCIVSVEIDVVNFILMALCLNCYIKIMSVGQISSRDASTLFADLESLDLLRVESIINQHIIEFGAK